MQRSSRAAAVVLLSIGSTALWNCASDEPASDTAPERDSGGGSTSSSSSSGVVAQPDAAPTPPPDSDAQADAAVSVDAQVDSYVAAIEQVLARCTSNREPAPLPPADRDRIRDWFEAEGVTQARRDVLLACITSLNDAICTGQTQLCVDAQTTTGTLPNGSACHLGAQCESGVCPVENEANCGVCTAALGPGASCDDQLYQLCKPGTACVPGSSGNLCRPVTLVGEGATCDEAFTCSRGLVCTNTPAGRVCKSAVPTGGICRTATFQVSCSSQGTDYCNTTTSLCTALPTIEQSCLDTSYCASGSVCDLDTFQCRHRRTNVAIDDGLSGNDECIAGSSSKYDPARGYYVCAADIPRDGSCASSVVATCAPGLACSIDDVCVDKPQCP